MLETLNDMNLKLEEIQKSLDMYLETKRQIFPRFYFLSNDDLLEILGQSKNPQAVSSLSFIFPANDLHCWRSFHLLQILSRALFSGDQGYYSSSSEACQTTRSSSHSHPFQFPCLLHELCLKNHHSSQEHAIYRASCVLASLHLTNCHLSNLRSINLI